MEVQFRSEQILVLGEVTCCKGESAERKGVCTGGRRECCEEVTGAFFWRGGGLESMSICRLQRGKTTAVQIRCRFQVERHAKCLVLRGVSALRCVAVCVVFGGADCDGWYGRRTAPYECHPLCILVAAVDASPTVSNELDEEHLPHNALRG